MKHSPQTKELQHKWVQQHFMFIFNVKEVGSGGGGGGTLLKLLGII